MSLAALRDAIVTGIDTEIPALRTVQTHGGRFDAEELKRWALRAPAVLVSILGVETSNDAGQPVGDVNCVAFVITAGDSQTKRDESALNISEAVMSATVNNAWAYEHASAPKEAVGDNLYSGNLDKKNAVALWAVSWKQRIDLDIFDVTTLDDLETVYTDYDLVPADGVLNLQGFIRLQGSFMSAYGQIAVTTPVATTIVTPATYQKAAGTTTLASVVNDMDMPATGRLRHTGTATKPFVIDGSVSVTVSADAKVTAALAEGGVVDTTTAVEQEVTLAGGAETIPLDGLFSLAENEYTEIWITADDSVDVTATKLVLTAAAA